MLDSGVPVILWHHHTSFVHLASVAGHEHTLTLITNQNSVTRVTPSLTLHCVAETEGE